MKKKTAFCLFSLVAIPALVNYVVFNIANRREKDRQKDEYYLSKFGRIRYRSAGEGEPLLLVHNIGPGGSLEEWDSVFQSLSSRYKVYALDLLGFGRSDKPRISYSSYLYVSLINDFVRDVIGEPVFIAGSSLAASYTVMAYSFQPDMYKKMALISPTGLGKKQPLGNRRWFRRFLESPVYGTFIYNVLTSKLYMQWYMRNIAYGEGHTLPWKKVRAANGLAHEGGSNAKYALAAFYAHDLDVDIHKKLNEVKIPTHIVWGEDNMVNPVSNIGNLEISRPDIDITIFEGAKLCPHDENPKAFYRLCRGFFR